MNRALAHYYRMLTLVSPFRNRILALSAAICLFVLLAVLQPARTAKAQYLDPDYGLAPNLRGAYAFRFTGSVTLPPPYNKYNGDFIRNGRFTADGNGNLTATVVANYAGYVSRDTFTGTYKVNSDGTFTYTIPNLVLPPLAGVPNVFTFDGTLANGGRTALVMLSGVSIAGQPQENIGSVIYGDFIKQ